jgi:hypothetical protein
MDKEKGVLWPKIVPTIIEPHKTPDACLVM